jgi:2-phosphosulfolactate phosphatase
MKLRHEFGILGASTATGPSIVIDVFRAFSAAAYAFAAGTNEIVLATEVDEARAIASSIPGAVLMGEVSGVRPAGFKLGNSPGEIVERPEIVAGRTIVHRSSAGTRCARAALDAGAYPLYIASLVVASATAQALAEQAAVTIVSSGESGVGVSVEDRICADLIADLLQGDSSHIESSASAVASCDRARTLQEASFAHPNDVALCANVDRFDFAMRTEEHDGLVRVRQVS